MIRWIFRVRARLAVRVESCLLAASVAVQFEWQRKCLLLGPYNFIDITAAKLANRLDLSYRIIEQCFICVLSRMMNVYVISSSCSTWSQWYRTTRSTVLRCC